MALVSENDSQIIPEIKERIKNRAMLRESGRIAAKVLDRLDELNWSQKELAAQMGVSPQHINKIVRGQENLTLETIVKLQEILQLPLLASSYERMIEQIVSAFQVHEKVAYHFPSRPSKKAVEKTMFTTKLKMDYKKVAGNYISYEPIAS